MRSAVVLILLAVGMAATPGDELRDAVALLEAGRLEEAARSLERVIASRPRSPEAHFYLGMVQFRRGRLPEAEAEFRRAADLDPGRAAAWKMLGAVLAAEENFRQAEEPFRKACDIDPRGEDTCYYLARNSYALSRFEQAIEAYNRALRSGRKLWRVHQGLALALDAMGRAGEAEEHLRRAVRENHGQARPEEDPRVELGAFLVRQGRAAEALAPLEQAVQDSPLAARGQFELGRALAELDRLDPALVHLSRATEIEPNNWPAHLLLGKIYFRLGRHEEGEKEVRIGKDGALAGRPWRK